MRKRKKRFQVVLEVSTRTTDMTARDLKEMVQEALDAPAHGCRGIGCIVDAIRVKVTGPVPGWRGDK